MNKFDIHEWQAKQRLTEQGVTQFGGGSNIIPDKVDSQGRNTWGDKVGYSDDQIEGEILKYIGQTFASWMSPDNPPFAQEYAKPPYIDKLVKGIMGILPARMSDPNIEEIEVTGMEPDSGNMEKEFKVIGPKNQSKPLDEVTIEYNSQTYILDFEFESVIDDHGNEGKDLYFEAEAEDGTIFGVDAYASNYDMTDDVDEIFWNTLEITPSGDPRMDPAIRSDFDDPVIDEQNAIAANTGFSIEPGNSGAYATKNAFTAKTNRKKRKY
tara:strand:- start:232 stop:1032 length:801 start_codon:yes stop_codon:yes gene_type:complete